MDGEPSVPRDAGDAPDEREPSAGEQVAFAVVGLAFEATERARNLGGLGQDVVTRAMSPARWLLRGPLKPVADYSTDQLERYASRGRQELDTTTEQGIGVVRDQAARLSKSVLVPEVLDDVSPLIGSVLDAALPVAFERMETDPQQLASVVESLLQPVLDTALPLVFERLANDPDQLVGVVDPLLGPIIDATLPTVFEKLADDPDTLVKALSPIIDVMLEQMLPGILEKLNDQSDSIRSLVAAQSGSLATDMANEMRARVVTGDDLVERVLVRARVRRKPRNEQAAVVEGSVASDSGPTLAADGAP